MGEFDTMAELTESCLQNCSACGALIDVSEEEPFALMHCPTCGSAMRVRRQFGSYELQEVLGAGGMGAVYKGLDVNLNRHVALKLLRREYSNNPEFTRQFAHEAATTALINHPNVVKVYSSGADNGLLYIAMELVDKGSLDELMTLTGRVPEMQVLDVGIHIAQGLEAALQRGLIHRDVKPGNILFADSQTAKIVDFGLAVHADQAGTLGGEIWATPFYVAPEKLDNRPEDFRSDMYSLGATLFHALAGRPPHDSEEATISTLKQIKSRPVNIRTFAPDVSPATAYAIDRTLQHDPDKRFQSYGELIEHLEYAKSELRSKSKAAAAAAKQAPARKSEPQRGTRWMTLGMAAAVILGGGIVFAFRDTILGPSTPAQDVRQDTADKAATFKNAYEQARGKLVAGNASEAATAFRELETQADAPEPLRSWSGFHAGLSWTLAGDLEQARQDWQKLSERGPFSTAPEDQNLADFFTATARRALDDGSLSKDAIGEYSKVSYEALALLVFGAKNWALGSFQDANEFFEAFQGSAPSGGNTWVGEYKSIAAARLGDFRAHASIAELAKSLITPEQKKAAIPTLKNTLTGMRVKGSLMETAEALVTKVEQEVAEHEEREAQKRAEQEAADAKALADVNAKAGPLTQQYKFSEARVALAGASVVSDKGRRDKESLMKRAEWLSMFKIQLIKDIATFGYSVPIQKRGGGQLPGVNRATDTHVEIKTPYGSLPIPWTDVTHDSILAMGKAFLRPEFPADQLATRKWLLGVYALFAGKDTEGRGLLTEAAQNKPEFQQLLPLLVQD